MPYWLLMPVLIAIVAILGYPLYKLVVLSFQEYGLAQLIQHKGVWVGTANYASVLHDPIFWHTLLRTVVFTVANVGLTLGLGTFLALLLVRVGSAVRILLTAGLVLVWSMPVVVAVQVWYWITNYQNGILNYALTRLHIGDYELHDWYATTFSKLAMVTLLIVWGALPFVTITLYAGLSQVSRELVEAAEIDGAGKARRFRSIIFPLLLVSTAPLAISSFAVGFNNLGLVLLFNNGGPPIPGAPYALGYTDILATAIYDISGVSGGKADFGLASALAIIVFIIVGIIAVITFRQTRRLEEYQ